MERIDDRLLYGGALAPLTAVAALGVISVLLLWALPRRSPEPLTTDARLPPCVQTNGLWSPQPQLAVYDARQNLRLAHHFGPVLLLKQGPYSLLTALQNLALFWRRQTRTEMPSKLSDTVILVNSAAQAKVLLERHGATYSSRGPSIAAGKYLSSNRRIVLLPYGAQWRSHHKALVQLLLKDKIQHKWRKALQHEALVLVTNLTALIETATAPDTKLLDEMSRFTASSVLQIAYARRAESSRDPVLKDLDQVSRNIANAFAPSNNLVELYPALDWLPTWLAPWKSKLLQHHTYEARVYGELVDDVERRLCAGLGDDASKAAQLRNRSVIPVSDCCAAELLQLLNNDDSDKGDLDRKDIAYICATVFEAGAETTAMTINTFLLAAALHPAVVGRAQTELDEAIQNVGMPGFELMDRTPYVCAVIKECLRLTPTGSSGVAHTSSRTTGFDVVELQQAQGSSQCIVPAGATVLPNIYGIHHDPHVYSDPWAFNPDRFLSTQHTSSGMSGSITHDHHAFGFGRRICPGLDLASNSLYIAISYLLWSFDFHLDSATAQQLATKVQHTYTEQRDEFHRLFPQVPPALSACMDSLSREQLLLDAYTNHVLTRAQLASCISLSLRSTRSKQAVEQALADIHT